MARLKDFVLCLWFLVFKNGSLSAFEQHKITYFDVDKKSIELSSKLAPRINSTLVEWGLTIPNGTTGVVCADGDQCIDYGVAKVVVTYEAECETVYWTAEASLSELKDCVNFLDGHWYGGGQQFTQPWPLEKKARVETAYVTSDMLHNPTWYGGVSERYWISSLGVSVKVSDAVPLFLSVPDNDEDGDAEQLCFSSRFETPFVRPSSGVLTLSYQLCYAQDVREVHELAFPKYFDFPTDIPDQRMLTHPIWSTWSEYHDAVNQSLVLDLAQSILDYGYNNSQFEIDDHWETCYGEAIFNPIKFPDPKAMVDTLHSMGFRVTLWVHPFINNDCPSFAFADSAGYFLKNSTGHTQLTQWWRGDSSGLIDFTNPDALQWWSQRLTDLQAQTGMDSFKFDAGETSYMPESFILNVTEQLWPNYFTVA